MDSIVNINYPIPKQEYKVLVRCFTYNQSKYIEDALNSFAMQQTNFPFVCFVMDDASTDDEQEIIKNWMERECNMSKAETIDIPTSIVIIVPHKTNLSCTFAFYLLKQNLYGTGDKKMNHVYPWREKCEYESICEGDDYWIDALKLQKQVEFLDANPEYGMCYTRCNYFNQNRQNFERYGWGGSYVSFEDLIKECTVPTNTVMLRSNLLKLYETEGHAKNKGWLMGDYPMWLWFAHESRVYFIEDITSVYRVLDNSASHSNKLEVYERFMYSTYDMLSYFCNLYNCQSLLSLDRLYSALFNAAVMYGNIEKEKEYFKKIKKTNIKQKMKHIICFNKVVYNMFASLLFYVK